MLSSLKARLIAIAVSIVVLAMLAVAIANAWLGVHGAAGATVPEGAGAQHGS